MRKKSLGYENLPNEPETDLDRVSEETATTPAAPKTLAEKIRNIPKGIGPINLNINLIKL